MELVRRIFNREDFEKILDFPESLRDRVILHILHDTGIRSGELLNLKTSDVDVKNRCLTITDSKKHERFTLPIRRKTCQLVEEYIETINSIYLFPAGNKDSHTGHMSMRNLQWRLKIIAERYGLPNAINFQPRDFRRHLARLWVVKGGNLIALQQILRHKHLSTTSIYADGIRFHGEVRKEYTKIFGE